MAERLIRQYSKINNLIYWLYVNDFVSFWHQADNKSLERMHIVLFEIHSFYKLFTYLVRMLRFDSGFGTLSVRCDISKISSPTIFSKS